MKNPHGVEPTRYMKRKESEYAIECYPEYGPAFGNNYDYYDGCYCHFFDICIYDKCNRKNSCSIGNDGTNGYECDSENKGSLFVNKNDFSVLNYEVFGIDYESRDNINKLCKHPDIIMEYILAKDISEESLKRFDDDTELLSDLDAIHCNDSSIRLKISQCCLKNPSEFLPNTKLVNQQYDDILREWCGDYKWKLLYRASEHGYTAKSFHEYCDNVRGPTLIVIKSSRGWIFGGYTTQSWSGNDYTGIFIDMIY